MQIPGWIWLVDNKGAIQLKTTMLGDSPLVLDEGITPILGLDLWEHAYYFDYKEKKLEYVKNWLQVVNWDWVAENIVRCQVRREQAANERRRRSSTLELPEEFHA
jgi:superoxide dismutase